MIIIVIIIITTTKVWYYKLLSIILKYSNMETGRSDKSNKKGILTALLYEFCGSCLISYAYNLTNQQHHIRALPYAFGFVIAYNITGAHFNPATSLAVFITEKKFAEDLFYFLMCMLVQVCGCYAGCLVTYLQCKTSNQYGLYPKQNDLYIYSEGSNDYIWFGRVCLQEILQTFSFTLVYLILRYDQEYAKMNRAYKAIALYHILIAVYYMSSGAGACLNPALGLSQSTYMIALDKRDDV
jgi:glycerol uptake facilitator-like aquaporin